MPQTGALSIDVFISAESTFRVTSTLVSGGTLGGAGGRTARTVAIRWKFARSGRW
jgi:hypothetical protein